MKTEKSPLYIFESICKLTLSLINRNYIMQGLDMSMVFCNNGTVNMLFTL